MEFRKPTGVYDTATLLESAGIQGAAAILHIVIGPVRTAVIDPHPGTPGYPSQDNLALRVGESFTDPCNDVTVAVTGFVAKPPRLLVDVSFGGACVDFDDPTCVIVDPAAGSTVNGTVTLRAMADDPTSEIDRVEFWSGDAHVGTVTEPVAGNPSIYEQDWDTSGFTPKT